MFDSIGNDSFLFFLMLVFDSMGYGLVVENVRVEEENDN